MENLYCTIFIVDVSQNPEEVDTITSRVQQLIEDHGGVIKRHNPWGKRRLAFAINKKTSGFYVEIEYSANSHLNIPSILEKEFRMNDRVLRHLTYVVSKEELKQREMNVKRGRSEFSMGGDALRDRRGGPNGRPGGRRNDGPSRRPPVAAKSVAPPAEVKSAEKAAPAAADAAKTETPKVETPSPKAEAPAEAEAPKAEAPKVEKPAEAPKAEAPKVEAPKVEKPAEAPKAEAPKVEAPKVEKPVETEASAETEGGTEDDAR